MVTVAELDPLPDPADVSVPAGGVEEVVAAVVGAAAVVEGAVVGGTPPVMVTVNGTMNAWLVERPAISQMAMPAAMLSQNGAWRRMEVMST